MGWSWANVRWNDPAHPSYGRWCPIPLDCLPTTLDSSFALPIVDIKTREVKWGGKDLASYDVFSNDISTRV